MKKIKAERFIVKVQLAQFPYHKDMLVYNEDKSIMFNAPVTEEFIKDAMGDEEKKYFFAHLQKDGEMVIDGETEEQDW